VAKDPSRPFVVEANAVSVSAVGTAFNVRFASSGVEVLVTHGQVRVEPPVKSTLANASAPHASDPPELPLLMAGQKVTVSTLVKSEPAQIAAVTPEEMQRALSWQRVTEFNKTPLGTAVAEFNRQNQAQIEIRDAELELLRIGGSFRTDQPEAFVRLLERSFGITAERIEGRITLRKAQPESP
jgi:transmembrane sensor